MRNDAGPIRIAVLGAGGLGKAAARIIGMKRELRLTAICDSRGYVASPEGLDTEALAGCSGDLVDGYGARSSMMQEAGGAVATAVEVETRHCDDPIGAVLALPDAVDAVLICLPNLPNAFIPGVVRRFAQAGQPLVFVDVLKRTRAVELMFELDERIRRSRSVVMTGCGATPGMLAAAAVLAAQSFIEVEKVDIWWGVGIANWDAYKATIREDIAHVPGCSVERAACQSASDRLTSTHKPWATKKKKRRRAPAPGSRFMASQ
jgi:saccharopine dehydrogenase-like NADP-dependent oxidoreductase